MKKINLYLAGAAVMMLATACGNEDDRILGSGEGRVVLKPEIKTDVNVVSRASATEADLEQSLILWISNSKGPVRKYNGLENVPAEEWMVADHYVAEAWAGDSVSASFEDRWFKGVTEFDVAGGKTTDVVIDCKIANVLASVKYTDEAAAVLTDYTMTVGHKRGELTFEGADDRKGYFMMPSTDKNLTWTLKATAENGETVERTGVIENAKPATEYVLTVSYKLTQSEIGGTYFDVVVDQTEEEVYDDVMLELPPIIQGVNFDATQELNVKAGEIGRRSLYIMASAALKSAVVSLDGLSQIINVKDDSGNDFKDFDFINAEADFLERMKAAGINSTYLYDAGEDVSSLKINFEEEFTNLLGDGVYPIEFQVVDDKDRVSTLTLTVKVSNDPLKIGETSMSEVWTKSAVMHATALREDFGSAMFEYRKVGESDWTPVTPVVEGLNLKALLDNLSVATEYEYRVVTDVDDYVSETVKFTTGTAEKLPNAGFENWQQPSSAWYPYASGDDRFWDSGNDGSTTLGANYNICQPSSDLKHSGSYSAQLVSRNVVIKFAAGNIFIGHYLATVGTKGGVLGWGRKFGSRPTALHGYVKYECGAINKGTVSDIPGTPVAKGDPDEGIIYIALLDNSVEKTTEYESGAVYPVIINNAVTPPQLFSSTDSNVIAYGEQVWKASTEGNGLIEFTIPLDYSRTDVIPSYIILTCSASRYGDYFVGSDSSKMYIDDFELIYDK